jgi:hypothetical protein
VLAQSSRRVRNGLFQRVTPRRSILSRLKTRRRRRCRPHFQ